MVESGEKRPTGDKGLDEIHHCAQPKNWGDSPTEFHDIHGFCQHRFAHWCVVELGWAITPILRLNAGVFHFGFFFAGSTAAAINRYRLREKPLR